MSRVVTVEVTQEDIDRGEPFVCERCPIALALHRHTGSAVKVHMSGPITYAWLYGFARGVELPAEAGDFVRDFDRLKTRADCRPFSFTLELPDDPA